MKVSAPTLGSLILEFCAIHGKYYNWLVVWVAIFLFLHILGRIIPIDFHIVQRGSNHQKTINKIAIRKTNKLFCRVPTSDHVFQSYLPGSRNAYTIGTSI